MKMRDWSHHAIQAGIVILGSLGAYMISGPTGSSEIRWGFIVLLVSQAFWFADIARTRPLRWGVFLSSAAYTLIWLRGVVNYWA